MSKLEVTVPLYCAVSMTFTMDVYPTQGEIDAEVARRIANLRRAIDRRGEDDHGVYMTIDRVGDALVELVS